jgi:hypothetical protein
MSIDICKVIGNICDQALEALESTKRQAIPLVKKERKAIEEGYYEGFYNCKHDVQFDGNYYIDKYGE